MQGRILAKEILIFLNKISLLVPYTKLVPLISLRNLIELDLKVLQISTSMLFLVEMRLSKKSKSNITDLDSL
jgi:hypothetical protein